MEFTKENIGAINQHLSGKTAAEIIAYFIDHLGTKITFGTSLGAEDQIITQLIAQHNSTCDVFTLDTGRLFPETYDLIDTTSRRYKIKINTYFPEKDEV